MISAALRQLTYLTEGRSLSWVARETDIPMQTLTRYQKGAIDLNAEYKRQIKNAFSREANSRLKAAGFSVNNARIYSQYRPEIVSAFEAEMRFKIADLAQGAVASKLNSGNLTATKKNVDAYYDTVYSKIQEGMRRSRLSVQEQFDYGNQ